MKKLFVPLTVIVALMLVCAPILIARAPFESTMGLVQKIFYFHVPSWFAMFTAIGVCGVASAVYLFTNRPGADRTAASAAELAVLFGLMGLVTGTALGTQGLGRLVAVGREADHRAAAGDDLHRVSDGPQVRRAWIGQARRGGEHLWPGRDAVRLRGGEHLAHDPSEDERGADAPGVDGRPVLVLRGDVPAAVPRAADAAHRAREASGRRSTSCIWRKRTEDAATDMAGVLLDGSGGRLALAAFQPAGGQSEFVPVNTLPAGDQLPAAPLLVAAYAFVWLAAMFYVWTVWRRLNKVEAEMRALEQRRVQQNTSR